MIPPQIIEPPHRNWPQARGENLAHQGLIPRVYSHSLVKMTDMLHQVRSTIIHGKHQLREPSRKVCPINLSSKRGLRDLTQSLAHSIVS